MQQKPFVDWSKISYVLKGILVGAVAGAVVSAFRMSIYITLDLMPAVYRSIADSPLRIAGWTFVMLLIGFLVILMGRDDPDIQGNGVAELKGQLQGTLSLNWWSILWRKFIASTLVLGTGIPVGREGPSIQIGGVVGQGLNKLLKGNKSQENILISSGAAAGLSAAFNAPLSGLVIILEEVHHRFSGILILTVFSASVTANFLAFYIFGSQPALALGRMAEFPLEHYIYLVILGIILALTGWIFQKMLFVMPRLYAKMPIPSYLLGFIPFLLVIPTGLFWGDMLGGGTGVISEIASVRTATVFLLGILVFRFVTFHIAYGTGIPGGMLIPMLTIGAILGGIFGNLALAGTGMEDEFIRNFVIFSMGGFFTAISKAPLTAIVLITEITGSITQMMPIAVVCLTAYIFADLLGLEPIDEITLYNKTNRFPTVFEGKLIHMDIFVEPNSYLDGMLMNHLALPYNAKCIRVKRHSNEFMPHRDTVLLPGDEIQIACDQGFVAQVKKYIDKLN
ncbi:Voltage-gated chloride channel family protein [Alkalibacterium sp. AK22]|uniref:ClC family H(+)/Cl(-) exchange transporter n=1 Tax=Alkalibacterium sp. AK22 TaxID=1229520 RepID=UPI00044701D8|nr:ClC family H(+)/Cl(-) exchange transporter [Alkalibacterium sp. AK22]EXJ23098.1 Voltage-gated chloride channel family protein [Alkalibacterium sp. AK22]